VFVSVLDDPLGQRGPDAVDAVELLDRGGRQVDAGDAAAGRGTGGR
jgi:hypothetical protein